uniref:Conotoxin n=1 Tax=Conus vexillum TaxID=89431 RepID=S4UJR2_CONVX|nr:T superfamily conotoxin Vx5.2 precursor [Conus vexillum]
MLCLPVFIIHLLLVSPAATLAVESELQRDLTHESPKDFGMRTEHLPVKRVGDDCCVGNVGTCCS